MSSVYTNDLRLEEIGSGEQSGTWGDTTNTNLELIAEAFSFGTEAITTNADTHTTTIADGSTDPGRSIYLKYTGTLDSACTITLGPNTVSKVWFIENATSGSQNIIISQGSGANVTIGNGAVKMVYSDGAGSGAAVVDALVDLDLTGTTTIAAANISGDLDVDGTANLDVVDIDGALTQDGGAVFNESGADVDFRVESTNSTHMLFLDASADAIGIRKNDPSFGLDVGVPMRVITADNSDTLTLTSTDTDASKGPNLVLKRDNNSGAGDDLLGTIDFIGEDAGNNLTSYVTMSTMIQDVTGGSEDGRFQLKLQSGGTARNILDITGSNVIHFNSDGEDINFRYDSDTVANALFVDGATGYVSTGTLGTSNTRLGVNAGDAITSGGNYNVLIGDEAGTAITTGGNNVAVGYAALKTEDGNGYNVAVGAEALETLNAGANAYNVAVGYQAGHDVTTGKYSTYIGGQTGQNITTGTYNTAVGQAALNDDTTGQRTTAIGYGALSTQNFTGSQISYNTAVGYVAGTALTTGQSNSLVGYAAGDALTTGYANTVVGSAALSAEDTGRKNVAIGAGTLENQNNDVDNHNTAVGYNAGLDLTTGVESTFIGSLAGDNITTGSYNVAVGVGALSTDQLGSKSVAIGNASLFSQNPGTATDMFNVAIGHVAGENITTGIENVAVGALALDAAVANNYNVAVGYRALSSDTRGHRSVAIGNDALLNQNPSTAFDVHNVAIGQNAGNQITTGYTNTIVGGLAGDAISTADGNTAMGYGALGAEAKGAKNTAIGQQALSEQSNSTTANPGNVAVGYACHYSNLTGSGNSALGTYAGYYVKSNNNTMIGYQAMNGNSSSNTTGSNNTAVGYRAGYQIQGAGTNHTFMGFNAGYNTTSGSQNVGIGAYALENNTTSGFCVAVGTFALGLCTGSSNIAIGNAAGYNVTSGGNNIAIGLDSLRAGSPGGTQTTGSNKIGLGDENISSFNCQVSLTVASDERDKTDFTALDLGMDFVKALKPYTFRWDKRINYADKSVEDWRNSVDLDKLSNDGTHKEDQLDIGFKAQDVKALEEASNYKISDKTNLTVDQSDDGKQYSMKYEKLVPILVKAIQELEARVATLEGA